jgi:redox-sensitive bicupin YhaK (pirin superfamily)
MADAVRAVGPLGSPPWTTLDPFLFCVHHDDRYPAGDDRMAPKASLAGRDIGRDFSGKDGWSMYHGESVPGFPSHPHRGFETITLARRGYIDHSDSLGATARFGKGDVQWMTAGAGIVHAEMFPLVEREQGNHTELFQIWLNLPAADKMVTPYFTMLWDHTIPRVEAAGAKVTVVAGSLLAAKGPPPPPNSWASRPEADVAIWTIELDAGAKLFLPPARPGTNRALYFFRGDHVTIGGRPIAGKAVVHVREDVELALENGPAPSELLMLQGRPIGEPVAQYGPFVMNSREEIQQAFADYQRTRFGGWPWGRPDPVHEREQGRFARHADGRVETA